MATETTLSPSKGGANGEVQGSTSAAQLPSVPCSLAWIKTVSSNAGKVYIGWSTTVSKVDGTTDVTSGLELGAGEAFGPVPLDNLNRLWYICDNAGDDLTYFTAG